MKPKCKITNATTIMRYVLKHGKPYPMQNDEDIVNVDLDDIHFDEADFCTCSKVKFARDVGVHLSQVSRWLSAGMDSALYRPDPERLVWHRAGAWLKRHRKEWLEEHRRQQIRRAWPRLQAIAERYGHTESIPMEEFLGENGDPQLVKMIQRE